MRYTRYEFSLYTWKDLSEKAKETAIKRWPGSWCLEYVREKLEPIVAAKNGYITYLTQRTFFVRHRVPGHFLCEIQFTDDYEKFLKEIRSTEVKQSWVVNQNKLFLEDGTPYSDTLLEKKLKPNLRITAC